MNLQNTCYTSIFIELIRSKWCKILTCSKGRKTCLLLLTKGESTLVQWPTPRHRRAWCFKLQHQSHLLRRPDQPKKNALLVMDTKKINIFKLVNMQVSQISKKNSIQSQLSVLSHVIDLISISHTMIVHQ